MSYDPYDPHAEVPPLDNTDAIRSRVQAPAIALIVVGVLNMLTMVFQVGKTALDATKPPQQFQKDQEELIEKAVELNLLPKDFLNTYKKEQQKKGETPEGLKSQAMILGTISSLVGLLIAILSLLGGIRMRSLRSYGLSIAGAISAAIPCLSCSGTCCFGEIIGIWALIVLLNADVKAAFH